MKWTLTGSALCKEKLDEFLTYSLTNPRTQALMKKLELHNGEVRWAKNPEKVKTLWYQVVDAILGMLGLPRSLRNQNLMAQITSVGHQVLDDVAKHELREWSYNKFYDGDDDNNNDEGLRPRDHPPSFIMGDIKQTSIDVSKRPRLRDDRLLSQEVLDVMIGENGSLAAGLREYAKTAPAQEKSLINALLKVKGIGNVQVFVEHRSSIHRNWIAATKSDVNEVPVVYLNPNSGTRHHAETMLHESIHVAIGLALPEAQMARYIQGDGFLSTAKVKTDTQMSELTPKMRELMFEFTEMYNLYAAYLHSEMVRDGKTTAVEAAIMRTPDEFLTYTLTDKEHQHRLRHMIFVNGEMQWADDPLGLTLWQRFVNWVMKLLGISPKHKTTFERHLEFADRFFGELANQPGTKKSRDNTMHYMEDVELRNDLDSEGFYSGLTRAVEGIEQVKDMPHSWWMAAIRKVAKKSEIEYVGLEEFMSVHRTKSKVIGKGAVLDYVRAKRLVVERKVISELGQAIMPAADGVVIEWRNDFEAANVRIDNSDYSVVALSEDFNASGTAHDAVRILKHPSRESYYVQLEYRNGGWVNHAVTSSLNEARVLAQDGRAGEMEDSVRYENVMDIPSESNHTNYRNVLLRHSGLEKWKKHGWHGHFANMIMWDLDDGAELHFGEGQSDMDTFRQAVWLYGGGACESDCGVACKDPTLCNDDCGYRTRRKRRLQVLFDNR